MQKSNLFSVNETGFLATGNNIMADAKLSAAAVIGEKMKVTGSRKKSGMNPIIIIDDTNGC